MLQNYACYAYGMKPCNWYKWCKTTQTLSWYETIQNHAYNVNDEYNTKHA